jgi:hypothetical protein
VVDGVPLRDHPAFYMVNAYLPGGFTGIRDPNSVRIQDLPGYSRAAFMAAVLDELQTLTDCFPHQYVQIGFWKVTDRESSPALWEELRTSILAEFDGIRRPRVGFYMENLAASRPFSGSPELQGYPLTDFGAALYLSRDQTWTAFQALTSWRQPFTGFDKVAHATPMDGLSYAFTTYGSTYAELYLSDVENPEWTAGLTDWSQRLLNAIPPAPAHVTDWDRY